jgi:hypothetical protein
MLNNFHSKPRLTKPIKDRLMLKSEDTTGVRKEGINEDTRM